MKITNNGDLADYDGRALRSRSCWWWWRQSANQRLIDRHRRPPSLPICTWLSVVGFTDIICLLCSSTAPPFAVVKRLIAAITARSHYPRRVGARIFPLFVFTYASSSDRFARSYKFLCLEIGTYHHLPICIKCKISKPRNDHDHG